MIAALLIAGGALAHAAWNIALKASTAGGIRFVALTVVLATALLAPVGAPALLPVLVEHPSVAGLLLASGALHCGYFLLLQRSYAVADVSVVYPLARGTGPFLSVVAAVVLLGERPASVALLGGGVVVAGVVVIGLAGARPSSAPSTSDAATDARRRRRRLGIVLGAGVGILIAGYTVLDAVAVTAAGLSPVGYFWGSLVVQLMILAPLLIANPGETVATARRHPRAIAAVGILSPIAYVLVLAAYAHAPVAIVAPAREVSVVLIALAGWLLFREPHPVQRLIGSAVVVAGVALLASG
ncbi:EamA family transporter [Microcella alkalica]|uniref:Drug/metabolite transporter (DMT)-like permease n=1 Tax=Microcella alkalica TaxID=355930 RepID=A0A839E712_9MICO|nr:drug/metabolite transporter (DMT)-like permease [Microcella alkalica]